MTEISGVIVSITLVMAAVFVPVGFMQGPAGVFYKQFAFTLVTAILITAVNALTLSPALCALFLKSADHEKRTYAQRFFNGFNAAFKATTNRYTRGVGFLLKNKYVAISALVLISVLTFFMVRNAPTG